jgi:hypothetical protein
MSELDQVPCAAPAWKSCLAVVEHEQVIAISAGQLIVPPPPLMVPLL